MTDLTSRIDDASEHERRAQPQAVGYAARTLWREVDERRQALAAIQDALRDFEARFDTEPIAAPRSRLETVVTILECALILIAGGVVIGLVLT